jgi:hypothetical protein
MQHTNRHPVIHDDNDDDDDEEHEHEHEEALIDLAKLVKEVGKRLWKSLSSRPNPSSVTKNAAPCPSGQKASTIVEVNSSQSQPRHLTPDQVRFETKQDDEALGASVVDVTILDTHSQELTHLD